MAEGGRDLLRKHGLAGGILLFRHCAPTAHAKNPLIGFCAHTRGRSDAGARSRRGQLEGGRYRGVARVESCLEQSRQPAMFDCNVDA